MYNVYQPSPPCCNGDDGRQQWVSNTGGPIKHALKLLMACMYQRNSFLQDRIISVPGETKKVISNQSNNNNAHYYSLKLACKQKKSGACEAHHSTVYWSTTATTAGSWPCLKSTGQWLQVTRKWDAGAEMLTSGNGGPAVLISTEHNLVCRLQRCRNIWCKLFHIRSQKDQFKWSTV